MVRYVATNDGGEIELAFFNSMEKDIIGKPLSFLFCPPFSCIGPNMQVAVLFLRQPNCSYLYDLTFAYVVRNSIATQATQRTRM